MQTEADRWARVVARDPTADFFYAVTTTGVVCRTGCGARRPLRENVRFFGSLRAAVAEGFRPCLRCQPGEGAATGLAARIGELCRHIDGCDDAPTLAELATLAGVSPSHLQRVFVATTGLSPRAYAAARRAERLRDALPSAPSITHAGYEAGYGSSGRLYEGGAARLGMTPGAYRRGGAGEHIEWAFGATSLGRVLVARTERGLCAVLLGDDDASLLADLGRRFPAATLAAGSFRRLLQQVIEQVDQPGRGGALPLDVRGTAFQERVWRALQGVGPGETTTYAELARRIGAPSAARAVAQACGANPAAVVIPCHRVVRRDGALAGYRWGLQRKRALLTKEKAR